MSLNNVKVIVVDDSALIRALLQEVLDADERIDVVATAKDAYEARELIKKHNPDVITLDIEMPKMNGIVFLENLMRLRPMPVVMISTLTQAGAPDTLRALELGAVDFVPKPKTGNESELGQYGELIREKVFSAANANVRSDKDGINTAEIKIEEKHVNQLFAHKILKKDFICAIGASTGGTEAIKEVLAVLPENSPPIVITQHIPEAFSASFAKRVDGLAKITVCEAEHNQPVRSGVAYIAPGHSHMRIAKGGSGGYIIKLENSEPVNRHKPAVEVLFDSIRNVAGKNSMGILLTGMGADGAEALLRMRQSGIYTVAQDEASSVVWGMPGAAVKLDAVEKVLSLHKVARCIMSHAFN